jgi:hypothetical protein
VDSPGSGRLSGDAVTDKIGKPWGVEMRNNVKKTNKTITVTVFRNIFQNTSIEAEGVMR